MIGLDYLASREAVSERDLRVASNIDVSEKVFPFRIGVDIPEGVPAPVITVEDLATGAWGGARYR